MSELDYDAVPYSTPNGSSLRFNLNKIEVQVQGNSLTFNLKSLVYIPPQGNKLNFNLSVSEYIPPQGNALSFNFKHDQDDEDSNVPGDNQYVYPEGYIASAFGAEAFIRLGYRRLNTVGFNQSGVGVPGVRNDTQYLKPYGFDALGFSRQTIRNKNVTVTVPGMDLSRVAMPSIINFHKNVYGKGFANELLGQPTIYNLLKFVRLNNRGIDSSSFGTAYLQGGVRFVRPSGMASFGVGQAKVINTRADQTVRLTGIAAPSFPRPNVSPQILTVRGILGTQWGSPYVQRNPSPAGWISERFGTAWVSRSPRFYTVTVGQVTQFGLAKVFDAKQTVTITGVIPGGIFGDIQIRNLNFKVTPGSIEAPPLSDWTKVENTARYYQLKGFDSSQFGNASINNGTPSFAPDGFDSASFGNALVAERIRRINTPGFSLLSFGRPTVTKTPQLSPRSIAPLDLGQPTLTLYTRYIVSSGRMMMAMGEPSIGMAKRKLAVGGFNSMRLGDPVITHGQRELLAQGSNHSRYGNAHQVWFRVRSIAPASIYEDQKQYGHRLGGSQHIQAKGFDATLFGTRIIPESQSILASNFASSVFGTARLQKTREYLSVVGFATGGQQPADRWGKTTVYNSRQYIIQTYDVDSELNPPKMNAWTSIVNRNRIIGSTGSTMTLFGRPSILNKARPILPKGLDHSKFGVQFVSAGIRKIMPEGLDAPYFSGWTNLHNAAAVLKPKGFATEKFGTVSVTNIRRYFPRIGNFETMLFGEPMISFKIRNLTFESRYSIGPIYIPIHKVDLYTRYVQATANDFAVFGLPALTIHKKIITPRWTLRDLFGDVGLRNVTPEIKTRGRNSEEFGTASIRTQWRTIETFGESMQLWGKPVIADRKRTMTVAGFNANAIGHALRVRGTASPPLSTQYIYLNNVENRGEDQDDDTSVIKDGYGIAPPFFQVSDPSLRSNVIRAEGFVATKFGENKIHSNGIWMENGIKLDKECGTPSVQLSRRTLSVEGISNSIVMGTPRLSPHTIYAVMEAPQQAKDNHPASNLHYVNSDGGSHKAGEVFGRARVWQHNPYLNVRGINPLNRYGTPTVQLKRHYIDVKGIQAYRFGWHSVGDGKQIITTRAGVPFTVFGVATIALVKDKQIQVKPFGLAAPTINKPIVQHLHRTFKIEGIDSLRMGSSRGGPMYMPQSLHVGPRMPVIPIGELMEKFGTTRISLKVRNLVMTGFDSLVMEYDAANFDKRMRVKHGQGGTPAKPVQYLTPVGFDALRSSASNVRAGVHYIRPDGNSDQFRKGGF